MIGLSPVNAQAVNDAGLGAVWHVASVSASAAAVASNQGAVRVRRTARLLAAASASAPVAAVHGIRTASAATVAQATRSWMLFHRGRTVSASAVTRASASAGPWPAERFATPAPAIAKAQSSPAGMLVNASYLVVSVRAVAAVTATVATQIMMTMRSAYVVARATAISRPFVRRLASIRNGVAARASVLTRAVRRRVGAASVETSVSAMVSNSTVLKFAAASATMTAIIRRASFVFLHLVSAQARARAVASADMVTWMYVHEPDYRTVFVRNDASTTRMQTFRKQPAEVLPYDIDFAEWLSPLIGDDVESTQVFVAGAVNGSIDDLSIDRVVLLAKDIYGVQDIQASRVKVWLSGGNHGATYKITVRADTEGGRRKEVDFRLMVREV